MQIELTQDIVSEITKESLISNYKDLYESFLKCEFTKKGTGIFSYEFEEEIINLCDYLKSLKGVLEYYGVETYSLSREIREEFLEEHKGNYKDKIEEEQIKINI